jgi:hypothetical protein
MIPRATYRLQFHAPFGFDDAAALAPYLAQLGISHLYASPYLKARPGSLHGYDIVDHSQLNPELGDDSSFRRLRLQAKSPAPVDTLGVSFLAASRTPLLRYHSIQSATAQAASNALSNVNSFSALMGLLVIRR